MSPSRWTSSVASWAPSPSRPPRGFGQLDRWARRLGSVQRFGIEGTGSYGTGLARWLTARGHEVAETNPNRQVRRRRGKSDPIDAEVAARAALAALVT
jgi:transposase